MFEFMFILEMMMDTMLMMTCSLKSTRLLGEMLHAAAQEVTVEMTDNDRVDDQSNWIRARK